MTEKASHDTAYSGGHTQVGQCVVAVRDMCSFDSFDFSHDFTDLFGGGTVYNYREASGTVSELFNFFRGVAAAAGED